MPTWVEPAIYILSGLITSAITYGAVRSRITSLERDISRIWTLFDNHVTRAHFEAVISQLQNNQQEMQRDIKAILGMVSKLTGERE